MIAPIKPGAKPGALGAAASLLLLAACGGTTTEKDFLCPAQTGGSPCTTITRADPGGRMAAIPVRESRSDTRGKEISQAPLVVAAGKGGGASLSAVGDGGMPYRAAQYRIPEQVGTLWIAPHLDADGLLHEAAFVHFVVREARWAQARS